MQHSGHISAFPRVVIVVLGIAAAAGSCLAADSPASSQQVVTGVWQHRQVNFTYHGITALFSCSALENNIRGLLVHFGARKDATVNARGCPGGSNAPSRVAIIDTDFYTLAPSADARVPNPVPARWTSLEVNAQQPSFMSDGACDLIEQMKDLISNNFSLRDLEYRTDCVPRKSNVNGFEVKAQALKPVPPADTSAANYAR